MILECGDWVGPHIVALILILIVEALIKIFFGAGYKSQQQHRLSVSQKEKT
jgi:hypothetical protein